MTVEELSKLSDEELRVMCAEAAGHVQLYYIRKPRYAPFDYYRPDACGYTSRPDEAWKVTKEVADTRTYLADLKPGHEHYGERVIAEPVPPPNYPSDLNAAMSLLETDADFLPVHAFNIADFVRCLALLTCVEVDEEPEPCDFFRFLKATPRQIAIAFIATKQREEGV